MEAGSSPLHICKPLTSVATANRLYALLHFAALCSILYYRATSLLRRTTPATLLIFASELFLSFFWVLGQAFLWRPVTRSSFPERLPAEEALPALDVFVCTADPVKEPPLGVMNTVISAMALDYPSEKLAVYLSDDGASPLTLYAARKGWAFARWWIPFCREYGIKCRCPGAYFNNQDEDAGFSSRRSEFAEEREKIKARYEEFQKLILIAEQNGVDKEISNAYGRSPIVQVIGDLDDDSSIVHNDGDQAKMPLLVYVSRQKRTSHPSHFKAGALNVLLRVSGLISNAPYILGLDCDMYSNDPSSARQAMCFHLDPKLSPSLAFVQFPQKFHNVSRNDIYGAQMRQVFAVKWRGMDGLKGPMFSGTCFYVKRKALLFGNLKREGFLYLTVAEDFFTGFILHCNGWTSVFCCPSRPAFLGSATTNFNDLVVQGTRWTAGLVGVGLSKFSPLIYGSLRMNVLQNMCYAYVALYGLCWLPVACLLIIPQVCLFNGIPVYPKAASSWFLLFAFVFLSPSLQHLAEVVLAGGSIQLWCNEVRMWMIRLLTANLFGTVDLFLKWVGSRGANFSLTSKVVNEEQMKLYQMDVFDFRTSSTLLAPILTLVILNMVVFTVGVGRMIMNVGILEELCGQVALSFFFFLMNYPVIEGMVMRKDSGRVSPAATKLSFLYCAIILCIGINLD